MTTPSPPSNPRNHDFRRHLSTYGVGRLVAIGAQFLTVLILSRINSQIYLDYTLALASTIAVSSLTFGWVRQAMLRDSTAASLAPPLPQPGLAAAIILSGGITSATALVVLQEVSLGLAISLVAFGSSFLLAQYFVTAAQSVLRPGSSIRIESIRLMGTALLPLALDSAVSDVSLQAVLWCASASACIAIAPELVKARGVSTRRLITDFSFGFPIAIWLLLSTALQFSDRWILGVRVGADVAAEYATSYDLLARGGTAILAPVVLAAHPLIMLAANRKGDPDYAPILRAALRTASGLTIACIAGAVLFSFIGASLAPAANDGMLLSILLVVSGCAWQIAQLLHKPFEVERRTAQMVCAIAVAVSVNIVGNWLLAPLTGMLGVASMNVFSVFLYIAILKLIRIFRSADRRT